MDFKRAESIVRKEKNVGTVWYGLEHNGSILFAVSPHSEPIIGDPEAYCITVYENGKIEKSKFMPIIDNDKILFLDMKADSFGTLPNY